MKKLAITLVMLAIMAAPVLAESDNIFLQHNKIPYVMYGAGIVLFLSLASIAFYRLMGETAKKAMFLLMSTFIIVLTGFLVISIIYSNAVSPFYGPVHWHAEVTFDVCGQEYRLASHDIATDKPLHTHGDSWVHVETTPITMEEVELHYFFEYVGGELAETSLSFPVDATAAQADDPLVRLGVGVNDALVSVRNGDLCNGVPGNLRMYINGQLEPKMGHYVISPVEAGDIDKIRFVFGE